MRSLRSCRKDCCIRSCHSLRGVGQNQRRSRSRRQTLRGRLRPCPLQTSRYRRSLPRPGPPHQTLSRRCGNACNACKPQYRKPRAGQSRRRSHHTAKRQQPSRLRRGLLQRTLCTPRTKKKSKSTGNACSTLAHHQQTIWKARSAVCRSGTSFPSLHRISRNGFTSFFFRGCATCAIRQACGICSRGRRKSAAWRLRLRLQTHLPRM